MEMENRILYDHLNSIAKVDREAVMLEETQEIKIAAEDMAREILERMEIGFETTELNTYVDLNLFNIHLNIDVKNDSGLRLFIHIKQQIVALGFKLVLNSENINVNLDKKYKGIITRYFPNILISNPATGKTQITSQFEIKIKQLNTKDFMDYAAFVLDKAFDISKAIKLSNNLKPLDNLEFGVAS